jgi:Zn-finger nucleic acid-binding protein
VGSKFCPHCGAALVTIAAEATGLPCPACRAVMEVKSLKGTPLMECGKCSGLWIDRKSFERICADREEQAAVLGSLVGTPQQHSPLNARRQYLPCAKCGELMNRFNFGQRSGIIIDICKPHGIWFDRDELRQIVEYIRGGGLERARKIEMEKLADERRRLAEMRNAPTGLSAIGEGSLLRAADGDLVSDALTIAGGILFQVLK